MNEVDYKIGLDSVIESKSKGYIHFDFPVTVMEKKNFIKNVSAKELVEHRYLPFITFNIIFKKYVSAKKKLEKKKRPISLPAHHDALVYKFFSSILYDYYDKYVKKWDINDVAVAYRKNGKKEGAKKVTNISVAKFIVDKTCENNQTWIIKGDFKGFFDNLDHKYLKKMVQTVLGDSYGPEWKKMLRSITEYRYISRKELDRQLFGNSKKIYAVRKNSKKNEISKAYVRSRRDLGTLIKQKKIVLLKNRRRGIPQGTAISATLANVYMILFDEWIKKYVSYFDGTYRRYSDDFIVLIPRKKMNFKQICRMKQRILRKSGNDLKLPIEENKTKLLFFDKSKKSIFRLKEKGHKVRKKLILESRGWGKGYLDYLGFIFDGRSVSLRSKSIYKFVYRGNRSISREIMLEKDKTALNNKLYLQEVVESNILKYRGHKDGNKAFRNPTPAEMNRRIKRLEIEKKYTPQKFASLHRGVSIKYLSNEVKRPRISMLGYAQTAQKEFERENPYYRVVIVRQVSRRIRKNQERLGTARSKMNFNLK